MYDELVKRLRECTAEQNGEKTLWHQAADAIEELMAERDEVNADSWERAFEVERDERRWIPVTERLPLLNTPVLATDGIEVDISWMYGVPPRWITSYTVIDEDKLTHWMPLPQTPKGG